MAKARSLVGLDVHAAKIVAAVLDADTGELQFFEMNGESAAASGFCSGLPRPVRVAYCAQPDRGQRVDTAQAPQPADLRLPRGAGQVRDDLPLQVIAAVDQHVDHACQVQQRGLRRRPLQAHGLQPCAMPVGPRPPAARRSGVALPQSAGDPQDADRPTGRPTRGSGRDRMERTAPVASHLGPA
jgi:hypothetical protein